MKQVLELTGAEKRSFGRPRCMCYGPNRHEIDEWKQHFFCGACDLVDQYRSSNGKYPADLNSSRNKCIAKHKHWDRPSDTGGSASSKLYRGHGSEGDSEKDDGSPPFTSNLAIRRHKGGEESMVVKVLALPDTAG